MQKGRLLCKHQNTLHMPYKHTYTAHQRRQLFETWNQMYRSETVSAPGHTWQAAFTRDFPADPQPTRGRGQRGQRGHRKPQTATAQTLTLSSLCSSGIVRQTEQRWPLNIRWVAHHRRWGLFLGLLSGFTLLEFHLQTFSLDFISLHLSDGCGCISLGFITHETKATRTASAKFLHDLGTHIFPCGEKYLGTQRKMCWMCWMCVWDLGNKSSKQFLYIELFNEVLGYNMAEMVVWWIITQ